MRAIADATFAEVFLDDLKGIVGLVQPDCTIGKILAHVKAQEFLYISQILDFECLGEEVNETLKEAGADW